MCRKKKAENFPSLAKDASVNPKQNTPQKSHTKTPTQTAETKILKNPESIQRKNIT